MAYQHGSRYYSTNFGSNCFVITDISFVVEMAAIMNKVRILNRKLYDLEARRDQAQSRMINRISRGHSNLVMTSELSDATQVLQEEDRSIHIEIIDAETRKDNLMLRLHGEKTKRCSCNAPQQR